MLQDFINRIENSIVYIKDENGEVIKKDYISQADNTKTRIGIMKLVDEMTSNVDIYDIRDSIKKAVDCIKKMFSSEEYNGCKINDVCGFSKALGYFVEEINKDHENDMIHTGIGVIKPSNTEWGKDLIKLVWESEGYYVLDIGSFKAPEDFADAILENNLQLVSVSCMDEEGMENVEKLIGILIDKNINIPVILGGMGVNSVKAYKLSEKYKMNIYYSMGLNDSTSVLKKALNREEIEAPIIKSPEVFKGNQRIIELASKENFKLYRVNLSDIMLDDNTRAGCRVCSGIKKYMCPLDAGYVKQKSIKESIEFINGYSFAVMAVSSIPLDREIDRIKSIWTTLLDIEHELNGIYKYAVAFKFPLICPFCQMKGCSIRQGKCRNPKYLRPIHEEYNIHIGKTLKNIFGDDLGKNMYSLIFIK